MKRMPKPVFFIHVQNFKKVVYFSRSIMYPKQKLIPVHTSTLDVPKNAPDSRAAVCEKPENIQTVKA